MVKIVLYGFDPSPPVRSCLMTLKALNVEFEYKIVNFQLGEHMKPEFLEKNILHTVPVLEDDRKIIVDSHVICTYLIKKYGNKNDQTLYPSDFYERAIVDQKLYFDAGILAPKLRAIAIHIFNPFLPNEISQDKLEAINEAYDFLEKFLETNEYLTGKNATVADICCVATVTSLAFHPLDSSKYPKTTAWIKRMQQLPFYAPNEKGANELVTIFSAHLKQYSQV
ncbi:GstE2.2 family protein [Megaselia abdita]